VPTQPVFTTSGLNKNVNIKEYNDFKSIYLLIGSIAGNVEYYPLVSQS
jgi:hypothetical protein